MKVLDNKVDEAKAAAIAAKKAGKTQEAVKHMKMMKMQQKEGAKLAGQQMMIMEQKMALESHTVDAGVFNALKSGHAAQ